MARDEEEEDEVGERPARSFNQTRVLTNTPASPAWALGSSSWAERANYRPAAPGYACLPVTNAVALLPGGCYLRHQRDLRIVDPLSNHSNRRRPAGLIGSVYARSVRRRIAFNVPPSRVPDSPLRIAREKEREREDSSPRLSSYRDSEAAQLPYCATIADNAHR